MCWQCDHPDATTDDYLEILRETIRGHGWAVQYVEDDRAPFGYTIGLQPHGLPELLVTGMAPPLTLRVLNSVAHAMVDGAVYMAGEYINFQNEFLFEVVEVERPDAHLNFAVALWGPNLRALQLVWADDGGRWPWDAGWGPGLCRQPVLGVRSAPLRG